MADRLRVLIVEDEPPARRHLRALLEAEDDVDVIGECGDGQCAVDAILRQHPDLVFLDVQIPELNGLEVIEAVGTEAMPPVVFVTAYDEYAVRAFELDALDYLLKPFARERLERALARARRMRDEPAAYALRLTRVVDRLRSASATPDRIAVRVRDRIRMIPLDSIDYFAAEASCTRLHTGRESYLVRTSISMLEQRLDPARYARVHRSLIVNVQRVRELEPLYRGEYVLWMQDGTRLMTGRTYRSRVQQIFRL